MNVGTIDRVARVVLGIAILALVFILEGDARWWGLIGLVPLATGAIGYCPLYAVLGVHTCGSKKAAASR